MSNEQFHDSTSRGGVQASLLAGLNSLGEAPFAALSAPLTNLGSSSASQQSRAGNGRGGQASFPFSNIQNSAFANLSASTANALGVNTNGANLNFLTGGGGNFHRQQQVANAFAASRQEQNAKDVLGIGSTQGRIDHQLRGATDHHQQEEVGHQQLSNLWANASSEVKSNLLQRLHSEESEARIISMILEQKKKDGSNNSSNGL